jgi:hypothetical protein
MTRSKLLVFCAFAALLVLAAVPAWADSVPVTNASFEAPTTLNLNYNGPYNLGPIQGWTTTGTGGVWQPNTAIFTAIPDGQAIAYSNGGGFSQDLTGISAVSGDSYTLSVFVGNWLSGANTGNFTISLDAGSTTLCTFTGNSASIKAGTFMDETCTSPVLSSAPSGDLSIVLSGSPNAELFVDDVSVTATPEPGSLALLAVGLGFLFFVARRRKLPIPVTA